MTYRNLIYLEALNKRKADIYKKISELKTELRLVDNFILETTATQWLDEHDTVVNKRNRRKLYIMRLILQMLIDREKEVKGGGVNTNKIFERLQKEQHIEIKYTTLRSYIHQLKNEGRIYQTKHSGPWRKSD